MTYVEGDAGQLFIGQYTAGKQNFQTKWQTIFIHVYIDIFIDLLGIVYITWAKMNVKGVSLGIIIYLHSSPVLHTGFDNRVYNKDIV